VLLAMRQHGRWPPTIRSCSPRSRAAMPHDEPLS